MEVHLDATIRVRSGFQYEVAVVVKLPLSAASGDTEPLTEPVMVHFGLVAIGIGDVTHAAIAVVNDYVRISI